MKKMNVEELLCKVCTQRSSMYEEQERLEDEGLDLPYEEQMYDEGYMNALTWVIDLVRGDNEGV